MNLLHNLAHLLFGVGACSRPSRRSASRVYGQVVAIGCGLLTIMGLVGSMNLHTAFGFVPPYGHDVWLHAGLALVAAYFGFVHDREIDVPRARL
ncbi:MAG TPA: DUF4383 domain-containing protein [Ramlibacter sp.]